MPTRLISFTSPNTIIWSANTAHRGTFVIESTCILNSRDLPQRRPAALDVDCEMGTLTLANGSVHRKDFVIAADGVHVCPIALTLDFNSNSVCAVNHRSQGH